MFSSPLQTFLKADIEEGFGWKSPLGSDPGPVVVSHWCKISFLMVISTRERKGAMTNLADGAHGPHVTLISGTKFGRGQQTSRVQTVQTAVD